MSTLTEEEKTFNRLRRTPYEEMEGHLDSVPKYPPVFNLGGQVFETRKHEIVRHYQKIKILEKHGWTLEEYVLEMERRNIITAVNQYNKDNTFPQELVDRAKEFFPNAKFTQAKIELE
jgi:hypothetical protein